jgi:two-component system, NtrC family, response regulator AlgB
MDIRRPIEISPANLAAGNEAAREAIEEAPLLESQTLGMIALLETAKRAAGADSTILLTGESGTGKDVLARQIHRWSPRCDGPFVVINCTTLAEQLLENELFGHVRGAFTGAFNDKPGRLEAGNGGTVLFDEIAELPISLQTKFLRFIQERSFERIGSSHTIRVDVRLLAASNRNLEAEVAAGRFREDLYYRLNVITFTLPPLRERTQDILPFAEWMLKVMMLKVMSIAAGHRELSLSPAAAEALVSYRWPGNLRELHNALERAATLTHTRTITFDDLPDSIRHPASGMFVPTAHGTRLKDFEREHILRVLAESSTLEQAATTLGINVTTLWRKRRHYGIA